MPGSLIVTDDWSGYASLRKRGFDHHAIAECGEPEVAEQFMPSPQVGAATIAPVGANVSSFNTNADRPRPRRRPRC